MKRIHASAALGLISLAACSAPQSAPAGDDMLAALSQYCGQAFEGAVTSDDPRDADWASEVACACSTTTVMKTAAMMR